jgi:hypothetical protein
MEVVEPDLAGDPITGERWVRKSLNKLRKALRSHSFAVGRTTLRKLLRKHGIRLKSNVKRVSPQEHPDRDRQFRYIGRMRRVFTRQGLPVISVDAKKKELIGQFKNPGRVWCLHAQEVFTYDFPHMAKHKAVPYGIYDLARNRGHVLVGISANTPEFAVTALAGWWRRWGREAHPKAKKLLILADGGGSSSYRARDWKLQLQLQVVERFKLEVTVCHYPPGASKWNPVEHRLFSEITKTWAGTPLTSLHVMLEAIETTRTDTGLAVTALLLPRRFVVGRKITKAEMSRVNLRRHRTCPKWNYTLLPTKPGK